MRQISASVYQLTRYFFVNMYLIVNGDILTVVDAGIGKSDIDALVKAIKAQGWSVEQIQHILITHAHYDHIGGLAYLQTLTNAQTYIHRLDTPIARGEQAVTYANPNNLGFFSRLQFSMLADNSKIEPARIDTILHGDDSIDDIYPELQVIPLSGHSYGQCGFYLPTENLLIGGDVMMSMPWGLTYPFRAASPDWNSVKISVNEVAELNPDILCLGHGAVVQGDIAQKINRRLNL